MNWQRLASVSPRVWVLLLTLACLLPFANKAFHIDDTLFLRAAEQIQKHPADFYGFSLNWYGETTSMTRASENPPLAGYYIALAAALAGWSELALHLAFLLPALAAAWGIFSLARLYCDEPLVAAVIAVLAPVFLISATTVMCDVMLLALWTWSLVLFERGLNGGRLRVGPPSLRFGAARELRVESGGDQGSTHFQRFSLSASQLFLFSGLLAGLALLTKFLALALVPLLLAYGLLRQRRIGWWLLAPLIPVLFAGGYEWVVRSLYGEGWLFKAADYSSRAHVVFGSQILDQVIRGLLFTGGCFLPVLFFAPWLWSRRSLVTGFCVVGLLACLLPFTGTLEGVLRGPSRELNWSMVVQSGLFLAGGIHVLVLAGTDTWHRRDPSSVLLLLWTFGIFVFASFVNWTVNGRSLLPMLPAVGILVARRLGSKVVRSPDAPQNAPSPRPSPSEPDWPPGEGGESGASGPPRRREARDSASTAAWWLLLPALPAALLSLSLAKADYDLADASRAAARYLCAKYQTPTQQLWFEGHWGFQYYMEQLGAKPLDFAYHKLVPGELVALPAPASFAPALPSDLGKLVEAAAYTSDAPCSTMTYSGKAAFYCALYGPLPFVFGQPDPATFSVYEVTRADDRGELQQFLSPKPTLEEITKYQALVAAHPNDSQAHFQLGNLLAGTGRTAEAIKHYRAGLQLTPGSPEALNNLAWILATDADATLRNAPEAVQTAEKACRLTNRKAAHYVGTLAAAYAEAGRFDEAVATGTEAIALAEAAGQPDLANTNRQMLDLYRAKRAYHQGGAIER